MLHRKCLRYADGKPAAPPRGRVKTHEDCGRKVQRTGSNARSAEVRLRERSKRRVVGCATRTVSQLVKAVTAFRG